jgi:hypothetical protein
LIAHWQAGCGNGGIEVIHRTRAWMGQFPNGSQDRLRRIWLIAQRAETLHRYLLNALLLRRSDYFQRTREVIRNLNGQVGHRSLHYH